MTSEQQAELGRRLLRIRREKGISLTELERRSGITKGYLSQLERGEATNPSFDVVRRIARGLEVALAELAGEAAGEEEAGAPRVPPGLSEFMKRCEAEGRPLGAEEIGLLTGIRYRGRPPRTADDYAFLLETIRRMSR